MTTEHDNTGGRRRRAFARWLVMLLRDHRKGVRVTVSAIALACVVAALMFLFATLTATAPPPALNPQPGVSVPPSMAATPAVVTALASSDWLWQLGMVVLVAAALRWLIADRWLEVLRKATGDTTILSHFTSEEPVGIGRDPFLDRRQAVLAAEATLLQPIPVPPATPSGHSAADSDPEALRTAIRALIAPDTIFARVSERRDLSEERASVTVTRTIGGDPGLQHLTMVPVLRVPRGTLIGSLTVTVDGKPGRTIPMSISRGILIQMLRSLTIGASGEERRHAALFTALAGFVARTIVSDRPLKPGELRKAFAKFENVVHAPGTSQVTWFKAFTTMVTASEIVFAAVDPGCALTTKVSVTFDEPYRQRARWLSPRVKRLVGIGITDFKVDLHRAAESRAYHLDITAPSTTYVEEAVVALNGLSPSVNEADPERAELIEVAPLRGDGRAHLYWRDFGDADSAYGLGAATPEFRLRLRERPPGLLGATTALSFWIAAITWLVGYFYPVLFVNGGMGSSVWATLILAAPALLTGWLLSKLTADAMRFMSLSTFVLIVWLAVNVAAVVSIAALTMSGAANWSLRWEPWFDIEHFNWFLLMVLTMLHLCACVLLFIGRGSRYARTINERVDE